MYHYDPITYRISKEPSEFTQPITNEVYNIAIHEAIQLQASVLYYNNIYLKITISNLIIKFYRNVITVAPASPTTGMPYTMATFVDYTQYTGLEDLIEKYTNVYRIFWP